jgi:hypothetical protein
LAGVVGEDADAADRVGEVEVAQVGDLVGDSLEAGEGDEGTQHVVGALKDREDTAVAQRLGRRRVGHVRLAAEELEDPVDGVPVELAAGDLRHG